MDEHVQLDLRFPIFGIDVTKTGFDQRKGTSPLAVNVRSTDKYQRQRGSSRPGLNPWFGAGSVEQVSGFHPVQHLASVVTASQAAVEPVVVLAPLNATVDYAETDHPPARTAPTIILPNNWYSPGQPVYTLVSAQVVGTPDGGGTGMGTSSYKFSTDGTTVTIVGTFVSAGFPGPYFFAGPAQVVTQTISQASFFPPGAGFVAFTWTVVNFGTGFIATHDVVFRTF